jgi:sulfur carrier protein
VNKKIMEIFLNGKPQSIEKNDNIATLLKKLNLENKRLAVEVNLQIIPRSQFDSHILSASDKVEIVQAIGGG